MDIVSEAYSKAVDVLKECISDSGFKASARPSGYPQVWARDSMITFLGALMVEDEDIKKSLKSTLDTLRNNQTSHGVIPNNVHIKTKEANYQAYADSGLWFVIGSALLYLKNGDKDYMRQNYASIQKVLLWYEYQDFDNTGLITMEEGSDWEDLLATRGKGLLINVLRYLALKNASFLAHELGEEEHANKYKRTAEKLVLDINRYFWYGGDGDLVSRLDFGFGSKEAYEDAKELLQKILPASNDLKQSCYYLPYLTFRDLGQWFDSLGNLLAILSGVADAERANILLDFIDEKGVAKPYPIKAITPPIHPGDKDWRDYYRTHNLNLPDQYHNGGIWPFIGGFYVVALVKAKRQKKAEEALELLAQVNKEGKESPWEFNEWVHGISGKPRGVVKQAWSAGMYIAAYEAVKNNRSII